MLRLARILRKLLLPSLLAVSLLVNIGMVVSAGVFGAASSLVEAITGPRHVAVRSAAEFQEISDELASQRRLNRELQTEVADLNAELITERRVQRELRSEVADVSANLASERKVRQEVSSQLASANAELLTERQLKRELRSELAGVSASLAASDAVNRQVRETVTGVSTKVAARTARTAKRETAVMAAESVPFWGTAVIVTATYLELDDLCETAKDMNELQALFDPSKAIPEDKLAVCGIEVPSRKELWEATTAAPGAAWSAARDALPSLEDVTDFELPTVDWRGMGQQVAESASSMADGATDAAGKKWEQLKNWWVD